jgi:hypothetical protein
VVHCLFDGCIRFVAGDAFATCSPGLRLKLVFQARASRRTTGWVSGHPSCKRHDEHGLVSRERLPKQLLDGFTFAVGMSFTLRVVRVSISVLYFRPDNGQQGRGQRTKRLYPGRSVRFGLDSADVFRINFFAGSGNGQSLRRGCYESLGGCHPAIAHLRRAGTMTSLFICSATTVTRPIAVVPITLTPSPSQQKVRQ